MEIRMELTEAFVTEDTRHSSGNDYVRLLRRK